MASTKWGVLAVCLAFAFGSGGCQPLYGGKPDHLKNPEKKRRPPEEEVKVEVKYVDDCVSSFNDDPKKAHPNTGLARPLIEAGDTAISTAEHSTDDQQRVGLVKDAIDRYRNALIKDPYNIDATLKLAIAYDKAYRKGCALALLKRLSQLAGHPAYGKEANRRIDDIDANGAWFKGYRKDAMAAVGR
jgi:hypothetical protein